MTAEECASETNLRLGGVQVAETSGHSFNILSVRMMGFLLEIQTEVFTEEMLILREMNRNNLF